MAATSSVGGVVPVPNAALLLRSSTIVLLPSQWSCMPLRGPCSQMEGKSAAPSFSRSGSLSIGKLKSTLAALNVSTRPGPQSSLLHEGEASGERQQPFAHERYRDRIHQIPVEQVEILAIGLGDTPRFRHDELGSKLLALGAIEQEFLEPHDVELHRGHAEIDARLRPVCRARCSHGTRRSSGTSCRCPGDAASTCRWEGRGLLRR